MPANKLPLLGEGQNEVDEQSWLQQPGDNVAPQNDRVKIVQLVYVFERIRDEGDQAENIEVRGTGSGPAAQQNVYANAQIDQRDQPQPVIEGPIGGDQNYAGIQGNSLE
jgi:hypothetical protein